MKQRISADVDQQILMALATGESNKDIAARFNVSRSYVSKVKTGKKIPSIKFVDPTLIKDEFFVVDNEDLTKMLILLNEHSIIIDKTSICEYLEVQMKKCLIHAKMYQTILKKNKGYK